MVQFDVYRRPFFLHKNLRKWTTGLWPRNWRNLEHKVSWLLISLLNPFLVACNAIFCDAK